MQVYDLIMLLVLAAAIAFGAWKGLIWQVASMAAVFLSYWVAVEFRKPVAQQINAAAPWNMFLAMLILYLLTSLLIWLAFGVARNFIDRVKLKDFDRQIGALLGAAKGVVLCVIVTLFAVTLLGEQQKQAVFSSRSGHYIAILLDSAHGVMPAEVHDVLHPYIHKLDQNLKNGSSHHDHAAHDHAPDEPDSADSPAFDLGRSARALKDAADVLLRNPQ
jgi:membrane protein required for colicin V production